MVEDRLPSAEAVITDLHGSPFECIPDLVSHALRDVSVLFVDGLSEKVQLTPEIQATLAAINDRGGGTNSVDVPLFLESDSDRQLAMVAVPYTIHAEGWSLGSDGRIAERVFGAEDAGRILWWRIDELRLGEMKNHPCWNEIEMTSPPRSNMLDRIGERLMRRARSRRLRAFNEP